MDGNKRTGALAAVTLLNLHELDLEYPGIQGKASNTFADIIERCAASQVSKDELMDWFESHKVALV